MGYNGVKWTFRIRNSTYYCGLQKQNGQDKDLQSANSYLTDLQIIALRTTDFVPIDLIGKGMVLIISMENC